MAKRQRKNLKWICGGVILIVLIVAGVVGIVLSNNGSNDIDKDLQGDTKEKTEKIEIVETDDGEDEEKSEDEMQEELMKEKNVSQYEGANPNKADNLSGVMTYAGVNDGKLMIRVNIDQYLASGKCELALIRNGSNIYSSAASIVASASTATCEGFDVPTSNLGSGKVEIVIKLEADGRSGTIRGEANI